MSDLKSIKIPDTATFEDVKHLLSEAIKIPPSSRRGVASQIVNLAAWNEIYERFDWFGEVTDKVKNEIRTKYNVSSFETAYLEPIVKSPTPPTIGQVRQMLAERQAKIKCIKERKRNLSDTDIPDVEFEEISDEEWHLSRLKEARDWFNSNGYVCKVELTKQIII